VDRSHGKVVFRNRLIELIQHEPATAKVDTEPVLIVPSWIMKYYILDLTTDDSLVKYLATQGHTVFMVSWKNPDGTDCDLGMDDYLELGVMAALAAVQSIQPRTRIHAMGYCLGGTLLAIAAAARVAGRLARLADIKLPLFVVATERDHVSPWQSVYKIHRLVASPISFVLSSGGHNVAIVNPPTGPAAHPQASYHFASYAPGKAPADPQSWLDAAAPCAGSWWPCWHDWLRKHSVGRVKPPRMTARMFDGAPLAAPGSHVHLG
jgi:poly(3-hydroxyalkanoate) synthetase